ncbi:MAG: glycosidase [Ruminiclostridium sp.]|nr:glycosidase [Ruminiclostridium sp.]
MKLERYAGNPILSPNGKNSWESLVVCNPGIWYEDGTFYLLYRAAGNDPEHYIHFGLATSKDGFNFERASDKPVLSPEQDGPCAGCIEDPRIVKFDDTFYITYAYRPFPPGQYWKFGYGEVMKYDMPPSAPICLRNNIANSGLIMSKDFKTYKRLGRITKTNLDDRDVILFPEKVNGKFVMLHRPKEWVGEKYGCKYPSIWICFSDDLMEWEDGKLLISGTSYWEEKVGGSAPPLKTEEGWLTLYHGVDNKGVYRVGVMLLDLQDPAKVIARATDFIMEAEFDYECDGLYNNCIFPTGNVIVGDTLYVYYGGADKYCCVATCPVKEILAFVMTYKNISDTVADGSAIGANIISA